MFMFVLLFFIFGDATAQERFRTILIERACRQRPSLSFCKDFAPILSVPTKNDVPLITPPPIETDRESLPSTPAEVAISTSPEKNTKASEVKFVNSTESDEHLGSLLRLPKPKKISDQVLVPTSDTLKSTSLPQTAATESINITAASIEDEKSVLVFVSEYCVVERERFVRNCHGDVSKDQVPFCKSYPPACASAAGVLPVVAYCQRYYKHYPKFCGGSTIERDVLQFCFAFEQFCLPELTPAEPVKQAQSSIRKCEDVLPEARKICNPFPHPRDTFNVLRCSNFLTNCKKFVDWSS